MALFSGVVGFGIIGPIASLVFGILVLLFPRILNYLIGFYLIIIGILGLLTYL